MALKVSDSGLAIIKKWEGFEPKPYRDAVGIPTIGYGNTFYPDGRKVSMSDPAITEAEATELLRLIVDKFERGVVRLAGPNLKQNQFDALVSFAYNLGLGALSKSSLLSKVKNNPEDLEISKEFVKWIKAGGRPLRGLLRRRLEEASLYFSK